VLIRPPTISVALGANRIVCAFQQFGNGAVTQWTADKPSCDSIYVAYVPAAARVVTVAQQAHTDSLSRTCVAWTTPGTQLGLTQLAPCSAAVRMTGLGITLRFPADGLRYAGRAEGQP